MNAFSLPPLPLLPSLPFPSSLPSSLPSLLLSFLPLLPSPLLLLLPSLLPSFLLSSLPPSFFHGAGTELRALHMLSTSSTTDIHTPALHLILPGNFRRIHY